MIQAMIQVLLQHIIDVFLVVCHDKDHIVERGVAIDKFQDFDHLFSRQAVKIIDNDIYTPTDRIESSINCLFVFLGEKKCQ